MEAPTVLAEVRVSEVKRRKPNTPRQKRKIPESKPGIEDLDTPVTNTPQTPKRRESKPQRTKTETPLRKLVQTPVSQILPRMLELFKGHCWILMEDKLTGLVLAALTNCHSPQPLYPRDLQPLQLFLACCDSGTKPTRRKR